METMGFVAPSECVLVDPQQRSANPIKSRGSEFYSKHYQHVIYSALVLEIILTFDMSRARCPLLASTRHFVRR
jgi:hypothetical protein